MSSNVHKNEDLLLDAAPPFQIPYNKPLVVGTELGYLEQVLSSGSMTGNGSFTKKCMQTINRLAPDSKVYLTTSGTSALEFAALLLDIQPGDEVIAPSYTYVSTVNAFMLRGAILVYVDVDPLTMCLDPSLIAEAITPRTRVILPVHYGSISADILAIRDIATEHPDIAVVEDAATCLFAQSIGGKQLGSLGHIGCFSFHETKNYSSGGQGGCIMVNDQSLAARADRIYENGTNRRAFLRAEVAAYEWTDPGSNFYMSETAAACLWAALEAAESGVTTRRRELWEMYMTRLQDTRAVRDGALQLPYAPAGTQHNGHLFWVKTANRSTRDALIASLKGEGIVAMFHFTPLHSSAKGRETGRFVGADRHTTDGSNRIVRLPIFYGMENRDLLRVVGALESFYETHLSKQHS